jgi:hypothetical protein
MNHNENRPYLRWLLWGGVILLLLGVGVKAWRVGGAVSRLTAQQTAAETLLADGLTNANPDETEALVFALHQDVRILHNELRYLAPVGRLFGWLPRVGPLLAAGPELLAMGDAGLEAAAYGVRAMKPALVLMQQPLPPGESRLPGMIQVMADGRADLIAASHAMDRAVVARERLDNTADLPWRVRTLLEQADAALPGAQAALKLTPYLPQMMGHDGRRVYLILAQNEDELRATGGFISGVGLLIVENGRILSLEFEDASLIDDWRNKPYDFPPEPLYTFMSSELFLFRDANFWPDFPTSAAAALELYSYGQDMPLPDGVIAIDQEFLAQLLAVTGPVRPVELARAVNSGNVIAQMRDAWSFQEGQTVAEWIGQRKAFMGPLVAAIRDQMESDPGSLEIRELLPMLTRTTEAKSLQIYMRDPVEAAVLRQIGWDGHLPVLADQDILLLADTNTSFNKANGVVAVNLNHTVNLSGDGRHTAETRIQYQHNGQPPAEPCAPGTPYYAGIQYEDMVNDCLWNYQRLYVAPGSQLTAASEHPVPGEMLLSGVPWPGQAAVGAENGHTLFSGFFVLQPQTAVETFYRYQLPPNVVQADGRNQRYRITIFKQAGTTIPAKLTINFPPGTQIISVDAGRGVGDGRQDGGRTFTALLNANWTVTVIYR